MENNQMYALPTCDEEEAVKLNSLWGCDILAERVGYGIFYLLACVGHSLKAIFSLQKRIG